MLYLSVSVREHTPQSREEINPSGGCQLCVHVAELDEGKEVTATADAPSIREECAELGGQFLKSPTAPSIPHVRVHPLHQFLREAREREKHVTSVRLDLYIFCCTI